MFIINNTKDNILNITSIFSTIFVTQHLEDLLNTYYKINAILYNILRFYLKIYSIVNYKYIYTVDIKKIVPLYNIVFVETKKKKQKQK